MATFVLVALYIAGCALFFYVVVPTMVAGPIGAELYRHCILHPRSWPLGLPFVAVAFAVGFFWPVLGVPWMVFRHHTPVISTQALDDHYGVEPIFPLTALTAVPAGIPKRMAGRTFARIEYGSAGEFWHDYLTAHA